MFLKKTLVVLLNVPLHLSSDGEDPLQKQIDDLTLGGLELLGVDFESLFDLFVELGEVVGVLRDFLVEVRLVLLSEVGDLRFGIADGLSEDGLFFLFRESDHVVSLFLCLEQGLKVGLVNFGHYKRKREEGWPS